MRRLIAIALLLAAGCSFASPAPIRERPWYVPAPGNPAFATTAFGVIYVAPERLAEFTREPVAVTAAALIAHEQIHAARQHDRGMLVWHLRYATSDAFRWQEESAAYAVQIAHLRAHGFDMRRADFVTIVTDPFYRGMVGADAAMAWFDGLR